MARNLSFALITLFWITMNALLWRAEFSGKDAGAEVPVSLIWEKILTSPDDSGLAVHDGKDRVGYIRWIPNVGDPEATGKVASENEIEGRIKEPTGYTIHADGNFIAPQGVGRIRFGFDAKFSARHEWTEWTLRGMQRPHLWTIAANRKNETIELTLGEEKTAPKRTFRFSDFRNPGKLLEETGVAAALPLAGVVMPDLGALHSETNAPGLSLGLNWEGRQDWLQMGHSRVKVYQLRARLLEEYEIVIIISRVGEILRVTLPGEMSLVNEALINL